MISEAAAERAVEQASTMQEYAVAISELGGPDIVLVDDAMKPNPRGHFPHLESVPQLLLVRTALVRPRAFTGEQERPRLPSAHEVAYLASHHADSDVEHQMAFCVDAERRLLAIHEVAVGGASSIAIEARQLFKVAVLSGASGVYLCHNHPSARPAPSSADQEMTRAARQIADCLGIEFLGHVVVAHEGWATVEDPHEHHYWPSSLSEWHGEDREDLKEWFK